MTFEPKSPASRHGELKAIAKLMRETAPGAQIDSAARAALRGRIADLAPSGMVCHPESLQQDPEDASTRYLALDAGGSPILLQVNGNGASQTRFTGATPLDAGSFIIPFGSGDQANIDGFATTVEPAYLPRPQGALPAIATGNRHPELSLPAAFQAFTEILSERGLNLASTVQLSATREMTTDAAIAARDGKDPLAAGHTRVSIRHLYHAGVWAAIRSGYRAGYTAEADHVIVSGSSAMELGQSLERAREAIHHAAGYTKFTTDTSHLFELRADSRHPQAWTDAEVVGQFERIFTAEEQKWILGEFSKPEVIDSRRYTFSDGEIRRLAVKFGPSLKLNEELFDTIRREKSGAPFDFEPSLDEADTLTTAKELLFNTRWLAWRGRPAQLFPPNLGFKKRQAYPETAAALEQYAAGKLWPELQPRVAGEFGGSPLAELKARITELAAVALHFGATLSIHSGSGKQPEVLHCIRESTRGRVNYKISGELQLQLFDVLSEQSPGSPWRQLYDRMVAACEQFAAAHVFGKESELAASFRKLRGSYLGNAAAGRTDGNLFLVFWLGNMVGSKDEDGCFFKDKLDALPANLAAEVRQRNTRYVKWLAAHLT
jgi:hypothetical protein